MHLRDGGSRERLGVEDGKYFVRGRAEVLGELLKHVRRRRSGSAVLQLAEFCDPFGLEQIHARRKHLSELDESRPHLFECPPHASGRGQVREFFRFAPVQGSPGPLEHIGQPHSAHHVAETITD